MALKPLQQDLSSVTLFSKCDYKYQRNIIGFNYLACGTIICNVVNGANCHDLDLYQAMSNLLKLVYNLLFNFRKHKHD